MSVMTRIARKAALFATLSALAAPIAPAGAGEQDASVRNCTWCHGTSAQGYAIAPRLAGQRPAYLETQLRSLHEHFRDDPFSKQYMWSAVAALRPQAARDLAAYFATIPPRPANDGDRNLAALGRTSICKEFRKPTSPPATLPWSER